MTYQILPVKFQGAPRIEEIADFVTKKSCQEVEIENSHFEGQHRIWLKDYPKDKLEFSIKNDTVTISGNAAAAPALCGILYTCLVHLGGKSRSEIPLLEMPISSETINDLNARSRRKLNKLTRLTWLYIVTASALFGVTVYLTVSWIVE